jgi:hypothetical protein
MWNTDISAAPVDPNSANIINFIGATVPLHPDFGAGTFHNQPWVFPTKPSPVRKAKVPVTLGHFSMRVIPGPSHSVKCAD